MERINQDELERRVDEVLFYKWDPIEINHYPSARAEYRSYVPVVLAALVTGSRINIINALKSILVESMGEDFDKDATGKVADLLLSHKDAVDRGHA